MSRKTRSSDSTRNNNKSSFLQDLQRQAIAWAAVDASKDAYGGPDPYVAGGLAAGMGMTSLGDSVHIGAMLGAEGAFSSSSSSRRRRSSYCDEDTSWREFCEDGSEYPSQWQQKKHQSRPDAGTRTNRKLPHSQLAPGRMQ